MSRQNDLRAEVQVQMTLKNTKASLPDQIFNPELKISTRNSSMSQNENFYHAGKLWYPNSQFQNSETLNSAFKLSADRPFSHLSRALESLHTQQPAKQNQTPQDSSNTASKHFQNIARAAEKGLASLTHSARSSSNSIALNTTNGSTPLIASIRTGPAPAAASSAPSTPPISPGPSPASGPTSTNSNPTALPTAAAAVAPFNPNHIPSTSSNPTPPEFVDRKPTPTPAPIPTPTPLPPVGISPSILPAPPLTTMPLYPSQASDLMYVQQTDNLPGQFVVKVISQASGYNEFSQQIHCSLPALANKNAQFLFGNFTHGLHPDLFVVIYSATPSGKVEIYILSGDSGYQTVAAHFVTSLPIFSNQRIHFFLGNYADESQPDLYVVINSQNISQKIQIRVVTSESGYTNLALKADTAWPIFNNTRTEFGLGNYRNGRYPDLFMIQKTNSVLVLSGDSTYQNQVANLLTAIDSNLAENAKFILGGYASGNLSDLFVLIPDSGVYDNARIFILSGVEQFAIFADLLFTGISLSSEIQSDFTVIGF